MLMYNYDMQNNNERRKLLDRSAFSGGVAYSLTVIINILIAAIFSVIVLGANLSGTEVSTYLSYLSSPIAIIIILCLIFFYAKQPVSKALPVKTSPKYYFIGLLLIFGLLFSLNSLNELLVRLFELMGYVRNGSSLPDVSGWKLLPALLVIALLPAILEESLFRGVILNNSEGEVGSVNSIFLVGLLFCLYHGSVEQTIYQFICGCLFTLLAVRSRSVLPCMLIHFLNNAVILVLYACGLVDAVTGNLVLSTGWQIGLTVASAVSLAVAVVWLILDKTELCRVQSGGVKKFFLGAAVGIVVMVLNWVLGLFV